ncbi:MAG: hypothetical protein HFI43_09585 [Lachnospiraceae bacterium]|jgi:hypothetical protein|nr:hypothetical protein [Lachnospiraceae bacterium]GFI17728.1 hypothetical protein IMSAGC009_02900 [Lachnospiraceae bacterium]
MGRMLLCMGKYAKNPYHFESLCVNVYCVEELCWLFASNPFMITRDIMDRNLAVWLDTECGLAELGHQLLNLFNRGIQPGIFVGTILDYVNYCTPEEKKKIEDVVQSNAGLTDYERLKKQADFLLKNHRCQMALDEYDQLCRQLPESESALKPSIFHNMGTAYGELFQFGMAAKYFMRAYEMTGNKASGLQYLAAQRLGMAEGDYVAFIAEHGELHGLSLELEKLFEGAKGKFEASQESRMLTALKIYKDEGNETSYLKEIDRIISKKKNEYREFVAG